MKKYIAIKKDDYTQEVKTLEEAKETASPEDRLYLRVYPVDRYGLEDMTNRREAFINTADQATRADYWRAYDEII